VAALIRGVNRRPRRAAPRGAAQGAERCAVHRPAVPRPPRSRDRPYAPVSWDHGLPRHCRTMGRHGGPDPDGSAGPGETPLPAGDTLVGRSRRRPRRSHAESGHETGSTSRSLLYCTSGQSEMQNGSLPRSEDISSSCVVDQNAAAAADGRLASRTCCTDATLQRASPCDGPAGTSALGTFEVGRWSFRDGPSRRSTAMLRERTGLWRSRLGLALGQRALAEANGPAIKAPVSALQ